ncbi:76d881f8-56db-4422-9fe3-8d3a4c5d65cf [Sclerotinia trifoliorum]|uniref:76d881f8-56db-4422-9fe3-8d3a4c5d65cf n=1 Tax=Sclerotinia trifoliorum TaxID=28548 RepID=A0A8H2VRL8_9HELO|nr:76d881f8-56db-4422-9fe3-8d3a4c5d65cf [Sclerotinia trifoliorum]
MTSKPIFNAVDNAFLTERNLVKPAVNRRRLIASSLSHSEPLSSSESGGSEDPAVDARVYTLIPEFLHSKETLEWLGWTSQKAAEIWARWTTINSVEVWDDVVLEVEFLEHATGHIPYNELEDSAGDWEEHMRDWGVSSELINAIMDAEFSNVRLTESAHHWVRDTMEIRYLSLERIMRDSDSRAENRDTLNTSVVTDTASGTSNVPGHLTLYKAISTDRVRRDREGNIEIDSLVSGTPSDFRGIGGTMLYFAPDLKAAEHYRNYIKRRATTSPALIIRLSLPNAFIEGLPPHIIEFGDFWRQAIHTCRSGRNLKGNLKYLHTLPLIITPIAHSPNIAIARLQDWQQVTISHIFRLEGQQNTAVQYIFQGDDTVGQIEEVCELKVVV